MTNQMGLKNDTKSVKTTNLLAKSLHNSCKTLKKLTENTILYDVMPVHSPSFRGFPGILLSLVLPFSSMVWAAPKVKTESNSRIYTFEFVPDKREATFKSFLDFSRATVQGLEALKAYYLVAELHMFQGDYEAASKILQDVATVALDDEFFNVSILQKLADCYMHLGMYEQAGQAYSTVSKSDIKALVPEAVLGLAVTSMALGDRDQAYLRFQELVSFYPAFKNLTVAMLPLGLIQWENGKYQDALEYFMKDEKNPACLYFTGLCQRAIKKPIDAMGTFKKVVRDHPKTVWAERAKFELGETLYQQKDYTLAMKGFQQMITDYPKSVWQNLALYRLACNDFQVKQFKPAEQKFWSLQRGMKDGEPLKPNVTYLLTESFAQQGKMDEVVKLLEEETKDKDKTPDMTFRLIWSLTAVGKYDQAIELANDFLSNQWDKELTPKTLLVQGYAYAKQDRYPEAVASYQLLVDRFPETAFAPQALHLMALAFFRSKQYNTLITQVYHQWNNLDPEIRKEHPEALYWIAEAHVQLEHGSEARELYQRFLDTAKPDHPLVAQAQVGQAVAYVVDKDFDTAIMTLQRSYAAAQEKGDKPAMALLMLKMGDIFFNAKNYENAAASYRSFQQIDEKHPEMARAMFQEGAALHRAEYYSDAVGTWEKMVKAHPKDPKAPEALFKVAKTRFDMGQYPDAIKSYEQLAKAYPEHELVKDARLQIGQCNYNAGNFTAAIANYTDFLNRYPEDPMTPDVLQLLQTCYFQAKKTPEEIEKLTKDQAKSPILADVYWEEGAKLYNEKNYDKARDYFQKIVFEFPTSAVAPQAMFYRAESLYLQEKYVDAVPAFHMFIDAFPTDGQQSLAQFHLAISLFNQNMFSESADAFGKFAEAFPDDPMAKNASLNVALCYGKAGETDNALEAYKKYIQLYPDSEDAGATYLQMGALLEKAGKDQQAAETYKTVPTSLAEYPEALFNAGRCYRKINKGDEERQVYEALRGVADKANAYRISGLLQLAEIHLVKNEYDKALNVYQDVEQNASDEQSVAMAKQGIQTIQQQQGGN